MPDTSLSQAIKEAQSSNLSNAILDTIILQHSSFDGGYIYLVKNTENLTITLDDGITSKLFQAISMDITPASQDLTGGSAITVTIDNTGIPLRDYIQPLLESNESLIVYYNETLANDLKMQRSVSIKCECNSIDFDISAIKLNCNITDVTNRSFATVNYTRNQFPGLGNTIV